MTKRWDCLFIWFLVVTYPLLLGAGLDPASEKYVIKSDKQLSITVGVVPLSDSRPDEEVSFKVRKDLCKYGTPSYYTTDGYSSEKTVSKKISYQLYEDLQIAGIFKKVVYLKEFDSSDILKNGIPQGLNNKIDAVLIGNVAHYYGYSEAPAEEMAIGLGDYMMKEVMRERVEYSFDGYTQLTNVELIATSDSRILWKGEVEERFEKENTRDKKPLDKTMVASRSFHGAVNKLVKELNAI